jgi:hypothetical protein
MRQEGSFLNEIQNFNVYSLVCILRKEQKNDSAYSVSYHSPSKCKLNLKYKC